MDGYFRSQCFETFFNLFDIIIRHGIDYFTLELFVVADGWGVGAGVIVFATEGAGFFITGTTGVASEDEGVAVVSAPCV
jgi:hypothetical protein